MTRVPEVRRAAEHEEVLEEIERLKMSALTDLFEQLHKAMYLDALRFDKDFPVYKICPLVMRAQDELAALRARAEKAEAEAERLREHLQHINRWAAQPQDVLTSEQVAQAIVRMTYDALERK